MWTQPSSLIYSNHSSGGNNISSTTFAMLSNWLLWQAHPLRPFSVLDGCSIMVPSEAQFLVHAFFLSAGEVCSAQQYK